MTRAVYLFGAAMVLLGLIFISMGVPIVRLEIGWTEIIGGSVAASAGCIILVLGVFLAKLEAMQHVLDRLVPPASVDAEEPTLAAIADPAPIETPVFREAHPLAPVSRRPRLSPDLAVRPEPALATTLHEDDADQPAPAIDAADAPTLSEGAPALVAEEAAALDHAPSLDAAEPAKTRQSFLSSILARRAVPALDRRRADRPTAPIEPNPLLTSGPEIGTSLPQRTAVDLSSGWDADEPDIFGKPLREPVAPAAERSDEESRLDAAFHAEAAAVAIAAPTVEPAQASEHYLDPEPTPAPIPVPVEIEPPPTAVADPEPIVEPVREPPAAEPHPLQPVVVGRYNAGSASYVMYSNGMIEVETEQGTHQFASMQELKAFIEQRDARVS